MRDYQKKIFTEINCASCNSLFLPIRCTQKFCNAKCKGRFKYQSSNCTTESQYKYISGHWDKYFNRLLVRKNRSQLQIKDLLNILEKQNFRCALSGVELTCTLKVGEKCNTNASIDRLIAGGPYTPDNVQLVCAALNSFRNKLSVDDFITWCFAVVKYHTGVKNNA